MYETVEQLKWKLLLRKCKEVDMKVLLAFTDAIQRKRIIKLTFVTKSKQELVRRCAPLDLAPSERAKIKFYKYHLWDFESLPKPHLLSISPEQVVQLEVLEEPFLPEEIVTWTIQKPWVIIRDWGSLS